MQVTILREAEIRRSVSMGEEEIDAVARAFGRLAEGRVSLVANFDPAVAEKVSASDVIRGAAPLVGGGGGGRATMARAGGKDAERLPEALAEAERLIRAAL